MQVEYSATLKVKVVHEVDDLTDIKDASQFAQDLREMICDEAVYCGAVATVDVEECGFNCDAIRQSKLKP